MTNWDQKHLEEISEHLKDIAHSLQIISGRTKVTEINKKETYADRYFAPTIEEDK